MNISDYFFQSYKNHISLAGLSNIENRFIFLDESGLYDNLIKMIFDVFDSSFEPKYYDQIVSNAIIDSLNAFFTNHNDNKVTLYHCSYHDGILAISIDLGKKDSLFFGFSLLKSQILFIDIFDALLLDIAQDLIKTKKELEMC